MVITITILDINHLTFMLKGMECNGTMFFCNVCVFSHVSSSYRNKLASCTCGTFEEFVVFPLSWCKLRELITHFTLHHIIIIFWEIFIYFMSLIYE